MVGASTDVARMEVSWRANLRIVETLDCQSGS